MAKLTIDDHRQAWGKAIAAIRRSPKYSGLELPEQMGVYEVFRSFSPTFRPDHLPIH